MHVREQKTLSELQNPLYHTTGDEKTKMSEKETMATTHTEKNPTIIEVMDELKNVLNIGFPILIMGILNYLKNMISVACMGRLGSTELAGGALAVGFTNITGYSVLFGLAMGMEPLCTQSFGSQNTHKTSLTLQRTIILLLFASLPIATLWLYLEPLLLYLHQEPQVVHIASLYCRFAIPDLIANSVLHPLRIFIRSRGTTWPLLWCTLFATLLHFPITVFFTFHQRLGIKGIAISAFIADFNVFLFLLKYLNYEKTPPTKNNCETDSLREEWVTLIRLAVPSCLGVCLEWWWYEIMTLLAGYLSKPHVALATSAIVIQTTSLMYTLPSALSASVSTRVGNELGAGQARRACLASTVAIALAFSTSVIGILLTAVGGRAWAQVFTDDNEVLEMTVAVLPIIGLCELANCPQTTCCGVLRGSARPGIGAGVNFCAFYVVGMPVAVVLAFISGFGFTGLCYGLLAAQVACALSILTVVRRTDWEYESLRAKELVGEGIEYVQEDLLLKCEEGEVVIF
ncbi:multidrug and toxin extrusion protein 1 [Phtheirospermum japonicum]|uniref:Protein DETOXIFICATION n=1 Tax=Phtheirospermum japonicum TaxID=374723 RepID=A0A830DMN4_9LAMI|nr:multidrug and toxin extrusion protein 1 [Phtheirospermum japonicum]